MGHFAFFLILTAACLLWTAACVAAATRVERPLWRGLLVVAGLALPILALLPWLAASGWIAFVAKMRPNWFGPVLTVVLSALIGGITIAIGGLGKPGGATTARAARWPVVGLFAFAILAKAVSFGTLLILDNAVAAEARAMRVEAAAIMQAALPPAPTDAENAAILHARAGATATSAADLTDIHGPILDSSFDASGPAVREIVERHAGLLDTIRRAADLPGCRFERDWTRPNLDLRVPEAHDCAQEVRILALAVRHEAAQGKTAEALADVVRIGRIGRQVGSEPVLLSYLVGVAIDATALNLLTEILPTLDPDDAPLLDDPALLDLVTLAPSPSRALVGEEAFGLSLFADFSDGRAGLQELAKLSNEPQFPMLLQEGSGRILAEPLAAVWRVFLLPSDIAGYRSRFRRYRQLAADRSSTWPDAKHAADELKSSYREGIVSKLITPVTDSIFHSQARALARQRAAEVLLAATRQRLASGTLPESIDTLVPDRLAVVPLDPYSSKDPMRMRVAGDEMVVWSVGPDGEDDGGPHQEGVESDTDSDDVGLRMPVREAGFTIPPDSNRTAE